MTSSDSSSPQDAPRRGVPLKAASRITGLVASVMDLHVRIALKEADREKRRLISGGLFLAMGGTAMLLALFSAEVAVVLWLQESWTLSLIHALLLLAGMNLLFAGVSLRVGGQVLKGPFLPQTLEGIMKTVRALMGRV